VQWLNSFNKAAKVEEVYKIGVNIVKNVTSRLDDRCLIFKFFLSFKKDRKKLLKPAIRRLTSIGRKVNS